MSAAPCCRSNVVERWTARLRPFLPEFITQHPILSQFAGRMSIILHGSTAMGIDDPFSDLDFWLLLPAEVMPEFDALSPSRFIPLNCDGKEGHLNATSVEEFADKLDRCDMDLIFQLRLGVILADPGARVSPPAPASALQQLARRPMRTEVRDALFFWHYTEMRGEHRGCDNPMQRIGPPAILLGLTKTLVHALQAAMVLEGEPYPYDKWLHQAAKRTPTGATVAASVDRILALVEQGHLRFPSGETKHPISLELRVIRRMLIESAREHGIDQPWLQQWWLYMDQAKEAFRNVRWQARG